MGLPVFPGVSAHNQLARIVEMCGMPPAHMLKEAKKAKMFFVELDPREKKTTTTPAMLADAVVDLREDYFSTSRGDIAMSGDDEEVCFFFPSPPPCSFCNAYALPQLVRKIHSRS